MIDDSCWQELVSDSGLSSLLAKALLQELNNSNDPAIVEDHWNRSVQAQLLTPSDRRGIEMRIAVSRLSLSIAEDGNEGVASL